MDRQFNLRQLLSLGAVIALTPALRLFPSESARLAGRAGWLSPLLALPLLIGWAWAAARFTGMLLPGEQFPELVLRLGGKRLGRPALALLTLWCLVYAAFVLRSGADRLVGTIYPGASPLLFSQVMGLLALAAALTEPRTLVRVGRMLLPPLFLVLGALLVFAFLSCDVNNLWPVGPTDLWPLLKAAPAPLDILAGAGTALLFFAGGLKSREKLFPAFSLWAALLCLFLALLTAAVTGRFGAPLTAQLVRPFFVLVRTLVFFRTVERVEALVVMLWIFPDFLMTALFLWCGQYGLRLLCGYKPGSEPRALLDVAEGRYLTWAFGAAATAAALFLAPDPAALERWSTALIPALNLGFVFVFLPLLYIVGKRGK